MTRCKNPECGCITSNVEPCWHCGEMPDIQNTDQIKKLRRRIEDTLRKSKEDVIIKVADFLNIKKEDLGLN
jgi:hypothetical protein